MFTGIIEQTGKLLALAEEGTNRHFYVSAPFLSELKIDQSVSHNGVCLTVVEIEQNCYKVTAIDETLKRTNLGELKEGAMLNLERCMPASGRFDGHIVQGHVDDTATCEGVEQVGGSWIYSFRISNPQNQNLIVEKGSICINGISLTVVNVSQDLFSVAIIPYTYENTNLQKVKSGDRVNIEYDILGKYIIKYLSSRIH